MTIVTGDFQIDSEEFVLHRTLDQLSDLRVDLERFIPTGEDGMLPYAWVSNHGEDHLQFVETARTDPSVDAITHLATMDDAILCYVEWADLDNGLRRAIIDGRGTLLEAWTVNSTWHLKIRFPSQEELSEFQAFCLEHGMNFEVDRIYDAETTKGAQYDLTPVQYETLSTALELGYFDAPRETTLAEIGDELGISSNAVSGRLRRAQKSLVTNTLTIAGGPSPDAVHSE